MTAQGLGQEVGACKGRAFLICNIRGTTPSSCGTWPAACSAWVQMLELCCFTLGTGWRISVFGRRSGEMVRGVTSLAVEIPVMVRLPHHAARNPAFARQITQNGARAISAIESLEGINGAGY